jgi:WXXGXW repeat (2 copies)
MRTLSRIAALGLLSGLLLAPIAEARTRVYVQIGPPPLIVEQRPIAPAGYYVWQPGYHSWSGNNYVWVNGAWVRPWHHHRHWVSGRWVHERRGYYWRDGYWRR